uniref:Putative terminase n=2 Tax=viral metagenome TaxID=1070528 RepID=A0A6M3K3C1_9ZZZZ
MGKKRGGRPRLFILDDPENDPDSDSQASAQAVVEKFEMILFRQIIPMLESGSCIFWAGTLINRRSFLYHATTSDDSRFDFWNRKVLKAIVYDKDDPKKVYVLWPEKWSQEILEARREEIGVSAFASEYCNEPVSEQDRILVIDPRKNEYSVEGEFDWNNPLAHTGNIKWSERYMEPGRRIYKDFEKPYRELVLPMYRILLFDYGSGMSQYNDYSCIAILGFDTLNTLWILDLWLGRAKDATLLRLIYEKGLAWRPRVLGIEAISIQMSFAEAVKEYIDEMESKVGTPWRARVFPITYPSKVSKSQRISGMEWRYSPGKIKYPAHLAGKWPFDQLYQQTEDFTPDLALLPHDDVIDTLSMSQYVVKNRGGQFVREKEKPSLLERIKRNLPLIKGMPLLSGVSPAEITEEMVDVLSKRARKPAIDKNNRRITRGRNIIVG